MAQTINNNNGSLTNTSTATIQFTNSSSETRSTATATLPMLSSGAVAVAFTLDGGDGGTATWDGLFTDLMAQGGEGGRVTFTLPITTVNQGQTITFYQGKRGESFTHSINASGGGGGSTAIVAHDGLLLAIAGGGGGGGASELNQSSGNPGHPGLASGYWDVLGNGKESPCSTNIDGHVGDHVLPHGGASKVRINYVITPDVGGADFDHGIFVGAGGGGGFQGQYNHPQGIHYIEITGKSADYGGLGGHHPVQQVLYGSSCDAGNPFSLGCGSVTTVDASRGGAGYSGGGVGGVYINDLMDPIFAGSQGSPTKNCSQQVNTFGQGGGGGGYYGGGGGDIEAGGGGGTSYIRSSLLNKVSIQGNTTTNPQNGFVQYRVILDGENPVAVCQNATAIIGRSQTLTNNGDILPASGQDGVAIIDPLTLDGGSTDDGEIANRTATPSSLTCADMGGTVPVILTVTDLNGNPDSCTTQVTVIDNFAPTITSATYNAIILNSDYGLIDMGTNTSMTVTPPTLTFVDNCAVQSVVQAEPFTVTCADIGQTIYKEVVATDTSGNENTIMLEFTITTISALPSGVIYVDANRPDDTGDGLSWATAKKHLNSALALSDNACNNNREIWVAAGTYYPDEGDGQTNDDRAAMFLMRDMPIYGGFAGFETLLSQRDIRANITILNGDLQQNDNTGTITDNAYHVVGDAGLSTLAKLDGFTITGGNANGGFTEGGGGAIISYSSFATISNCIISGNIGRFGGAILSLQSSLTLVNCILSGNRADEGGAIYNLSNANTTLINCTVSGNNATNEGGAIFIDAVSSSEIYNSIIWNNQENGATNTAGASVVNNGTITYGNSLVATISATGIITNANPLFEEDIDFLTTTLPTTSGDFRTNSPLITDAGHNSYNTIATDIYGNERIQNGTIDLGPFENAKPTLIYVNPIATATNIDEAATIMLTFDIPIAASNLNSNAIVISGSQTGIIPGTFAGGDTTNITFNPSQNFKPGEIITINVTSSIVNNPTISAFTVTVPTSGAPATITDTKLIVSNVAGQASSVICGDIDGDGDLDMVATSVSDDKIAWYENDGLATPSFTEHIITTTADRSWNVTIADVDGDGHIDIIATSYFDTSIAWYKNDGNATPSFSQQLLSNTVSTPYSITSGDIDNDGDIDILVASLNDDSIIWFENDGTATPNFTQNTITTTADGIRSVTIGDLDNDGDLDIISASFNDNTIAWYTNDGATNPLFSKQIISTNAIGAISVTVGDMNSDGHLDIVSASLNDNKVAWYKNDGAAMPDFTSQVISTNTVNPRCVSVGDLDGDGNLDIQSASVGSDEIVWYTNDGTANPTFIQNTINTTADGPYWVTVGDVDGNGTLDVVSASVNDNTIAWYPTLLPITTWTGATNNEWNIASNWDNNVPTISNRVIIPSGLTNYPTASSAVNIASLTINSGATLIAHSTFNGLITYNRNLSTDNWYLVSSPLENQTVVNFLKSNNLALSTTSSGVNQRVSLALYDNTQTIVNNRWNYYTIGDYDGLSADDTLDKMDSGKGFSIKLATVGNLNFEGNINTNNITRNITTGTINDYNLVGNPYLSYINANTFLTTNSITNTNIDGTIWIWNQQTNSYEAKNLASSLKIAPVQGFFVKKVAGSNILFEENSQSHETTDSFQKNDSKTAIKLLLSDGVNNTYAKVFFIDGTTTGHDTGYDSELFSGVNSDFTISTHLVTGNDDENYQIQSLPNVELESRVIPVNINANIKKEITISIETLNLPTNLKVFLEDKVTNTFIRLDEENSEYRLTLKDTLNEVGRFYLHMSQKTLNINNTFLKKVTIYKKNASTIRIAGLPTGKTTFTLFNALGKKVTTTLFDANGVKEITLSEFAAGVYFVRLKTQKGVLNKKIVLE
ncbi:hypothetical protein PHEL85_2242 [Polaribacter sp. Hel1_85]|nr:hypothetical protein PHEL85_2242 [Polaribacter sp. Hel1_85]